MSEFTHFTDKGRARMVDVSEKQESVRVATARGRILMNPETLGKIKEGAVKKGDVLAVSNVAAVMGAKRTPDIIPMCHPIGLTSVEVDFEDGMDGERAYMDVTVTTRCVGKTGVEMEALTAVATALLAIYDMCKALDRGMAIQDIRLMEKQGGRSGHWRREEG